MRNSPAAKRATRRTTHASLPRCKAKAIVARYYFCVLALVRHADDPEPLIAEGRWHGEILDAPRGEHGFGYDPLLLFAVAECERRRSSIRR